MNRAESRYFHTAAKMDWALIALLAEKPFEYISISEVCKRAGVNRSTFYLHYENICELLEETARYLIDDFLSYFSIDTAPFGTQLAQSEPEELIFITQEYLRPYLTYIRDNADVFSTALGHINSFGFDDVFERLFQNILDPILERFHYPARDRKYVILFYLNGINALIGEWLKEGCERSIDEMAQLIRICILGNEAKKEDAF